MIFANLNSFKQVAINVINNKKFYSVKEALPFLRYSQTESTLKQNELSNQPPVATFRCYSSFLFNIISENLSDSFYHFGFVKDFLHNPIKLFEPVETFNYTNFTSTIQNNVIKTEGSVNIPVLLPFTQYENHAVFMESIWRVSVFTFVPFLFYTDLSPVNLGGPLFAKSVFLQVNDNSDVTCKLDFIGGALIPSALVGIGSNSSYINNFIQDTPYDSFPTLRQNNQTYRSAKIYDCILVITPNLQQSVGLGGTNLYTNNSPIISYMSGQDFQIIEMSLTINQDIIIEYTANDGTFKNILDGPAFISLKSRTASGTITFISAKDLSAIYNASLQSVLSQAAPYSAYNATAILMYFGGPFFYPMTNVIFQQFKTELSSSEATYKHIIEFTALLQPTDFKEFYKQNIFNIDFDTIFGAEIDGTLKTTPQSNSSTTSPTPSPAPFQQSTNP